MSAIRDLIVVSAFPTVVDADELLAIRTRGTDPAAAAAPAVDIDRGPSSPGGKTSAGSPTWRTIALDTYKTIDALHEALHAKRIHVGDNAEDVIGGPAIKLSKIRRDARLVVLAVAELGFKEEGAPLTDVYARARQHGLELCPAEVGPQLRLQYFEPAAPRISSYRDGAYCRTWRRADRSHRRQWRRWTHSHRWRRACEPHRALDRPLHLCRPGNRRSVRKLIVDLMTLTRRSNERE
jgi:hypothetical protein